MPRKGYKKPRDLNEVNINLSALPLTPPAGELEVPPIGLDSEQRSRLSSWLLDADIDRLQIQLQFAADNRRQQRDNATTVGQDAQVLEATRRLSEALAHVLTRAPESVESTLLNVSLKYLGSWDAAERLATDLEKLSRGIEKVLASAPAQTWPAADAYSIERIASVVEALGIKVSAAPGSPFRKICAAVWPSLGNVGSPDGAIRAYLKMRTQ